MELNLQDVESWLDHFYSEMPGFVHVCSTGDWDGIMVQPHEKSHIEKYVRHSDRRGAKGIYLRVTTLRRRLSRGLRGSAHDSYALPGFWADIDIAGPGHKDASGKLPTTVEQAKGIVIAATTLPAPTLWVHSGGGVYPWWMLDKPYRFQDQDDVDAVTAMSKKWHQVLAHGADVAGVKYATGVDDLARVMRLPGTVNRKVPDAPAQCRILDWSGRSYSMRDLRDALAEAAKTLPPPQVPRVAPAPLPATGDVSPFDAFEAKTDWADILLPSGWTFAYQHGQTRYWVRPGKTKADGISATTGHEADRDRLFVFSTSTPFDAQTPYTKPAAYAILNHNGDFKAAAKALAREGFGTPRSTQTAPRPAGTTTFMGEVSGANQPPERVATVAGETPVPPVDAQPAPLPMSRRYLPTHMGNGERMKDLYGDRFLFNGTDKTWYAWDGQRYVRDDRAAVNRAYSAMTHTIFDEARTLDDADDAKKMTAWAMKSQNLPHVTGSLAMFSTQAGVRVVSEDFDQDVNLLNLRNGVLNLVTGELVAHDPKFRLTQLFEAALDPGASAPRFERFMEEILPDKESRVYVQKALGYTLTGRNDQKAIFLLQGASNTGKSQLTELMRMLFGSYGTVAASDALQRTNSPMTNGVHGLRGKRYVTTSETSEQFEMDEDMVKRLTGMDMVRTRELYEKNVEWKPRCAIWVATNHPPRVQSDDNAVYRRMKLVPMTVVFGENGVAEEHNLAAKLVTEASGILNWLLEGLRLFNEEGLGEPEAVAEAGRRHRVESDSVAQFIEEQISEQNVIMVPGELQGAPTKSLYHWYDDWCRLQRIPPLGMRRFSNRMRALGYTNDYRSNGVRFWANIRISPMVGFGGTMQPMISKL